MKTLNVLAKYSMIAMMVIMVTACGKKKNGSTAAAPPAPATPTATCTYNSTAGQWIDQNGAVCTPTNNQITCNYNTSQNKWLDQNGQVCSPTGNTGGTGPCDYWTNYYHVYYVPVAGAVTPTAQNPQGYICVNINYLNAYAYNTHYYNNYDYWSYNPPHKCQGSSCGNGCSTSIDLSFLGSNWGVGAGICF